SSWRVRARAAVGVLEPDDVVELGRGDLQDPARLLGPHPMADPRPDAVSVAGAQRQLSQRAIHLDRQHHFSLEDENRLVLAFMVLQRQAVARLDVQDLPRIALVLGEDDLAAPRLRNDSHERSLPKRRATSNASEDSSAFSASPRSRAA